MRNRTLHSLILGGPMEHNYLQSNWIRLALLNLGDATVWRSCQLCSSFLEILKRYYLTGTVNLEGGGEIRIYIPFCCKTERTF